MRYDCYCLYVSLIVFLFFLQPLYTVILRRIIFHSITLDAEQSYHNVNLLSTMQTSYFLLMKRLENDYKLLTCYC